MSRTPYLVTPNHRALHSLAFRLLLGFGMPVAMLVAYGLLSLHALRESQLHIESLFGERVLPLRNLKLIADAYAVDIIDAANQVNAGLASASDGLARVERASQTIDRAWAEYREGVHDEGGQRLIAEAQPLLLIANADIARLAQRLRRAEGDLSGRLGDFDGPLYRSIDPISGKVSALIEQQLLAARAEYDLAGREFERSFTLSLIVLLSAACAAGIAGWLVFRSVFRQLGGEPSIVADRVTRMAEGDFDGPNVDSQAAPSLLRDVGLMQERLRGFIAAQTQLAQSHARGSMDVRIDASTLPGEFGSMASKVNEVVDTHLSCLDRTLALLARYAIGDLTDDMAELPGDRARITAALAAAKRNLLLTRDEISALSQRAAAGDFAFRADASHLQFAFHDIVIDLNGMMAVVQRGIGEVQRVLTGLAEGDLSQHIDAGMEGDFGTLAAAINATIARLDELLSTIRDTAGSVRTAVAELAQGNQDLSQRTEEQAANLEETAATLEQLTQAVASNRESARDALAAAQAAEAGARDNQGLIASVASSMSDIEQTSARIGQINAVVDGLAFQTNLLALNAAVEAARAGERGRGFAVVASEIRALAQQSATAARDIRELIGTAAAAVQQGRQRVDAVSVATGAFVARIADVSASTAAIAGATEEQARGIDLVNHAIAAIDSATQQNAALVEQAAAASASVLLQVEMLVEAAGYFARTDRREPRGGRHGGEPRSGWDAAGDAHARRHHHGWGRQLAASRSAPAASDIA